MRGLPTIVALTLMLGFGRGISAAAAPFCFSGGPSTVVTIKRDDMMLVRGGMGGGGGMHCGPGCGGAGRGGMADGAGGGMGGSGGGMGVGFGGWNPFMAAPRAKCPDHPRKPESSQCANSR